MLLREVSECGMPSKRRRSCNDKIKSLVQCDYAYFEITTEDSICYAVASSGAAV